VTPQSEIDFGFIRVLDGGMATELERRGCDLSGPLWSAHVLDSAPDTIAAVHLDYLRAGADCIATASYQVSARGYREVGRTAQDAERALRRSVEIATEARAAYAQESPRRVWIAVSLGPFGAALHNGAEYHGRYEIGFDELTAFHAERLAIAAQTGADFVALETIPSLEEARAILRALQISPQVPATWISFTCRDGQNVAHGESLRDCAEAAADSPHVIAVGINCTAPHLVTELISEAQRGAGERKPLIVYPNSGETWDATRRRWGGEADTKRYGAMAGGWFRAKVQAVGGCCRTGPAHIAEVRHAAETTAARPG
jgi:homocysteine S-methyltransferase